MHSREIIDSLIEKYFAGTITPDEQKVLEEWYITQSNKKSEWVLEDHDEQQLSSRLLYNIKRGIDKPNSSRYKIIKWYRIAAAASFLLLLFVYLYHELTPDKPPVLKTAKSNQQRYKNDIPPGGNKAMLTLADGSEVSLDDTKKGVLAKQGNAVINKDENGKIVYNEGGDRPNSSQDNSITTPKGGQYQVVLSDGTRVWLNAASSLKYPTSFSGKQRTVELTGEAYFEVAKNKEMPFHVKINNMEVEVLGTHFDIMAYPDEKTVNTTLLEGSVKIHRGDVHKSIVPGQQALCYTTTGAVDIQHADIDETMAWQKGYYVFKSENIKSIMRKIDRWYDVEIVYAGNADDKTFSGKISRFKNISEILQLLELTEDVKFKIEGRRITVMQ